LNFLQSLFSGDSISLKLMGLPSLEVITLRNLIDFYIIRENWRYVNLVSEREILRLRLRMTQSKLCQNDNDEWIKMIK